MNFVFLISAFQLKIQASTKRALIILLVVLAQKLSPSLFLKNLMVVGRKLAMKT